MFRDLLFRRRQCVFVAFDLLFLNGKDLRTLPLLERKKLLKKIVGRRHWIKVKNSRYSQLEGREELFERV